MSANNVSRETDTSLASLSTEKIAKLKEFVNLLDRWRGVTDLLSNHAFREVWTRHIEDSLLLHLDQPTAFRWLDIGSGAGFPAVVIGVALLGVPGAQIHCIESDGRKCAFLRVVTEKLGVPLKIHNHRAEDLNRLGIGNVHAVTARAFSTIGKIMDFADPFLREGAVAVLPRGKTFRSEIEQVDSRRYSLQTNRSLYGGAIFRISVKLKGP